MIKKIFLKRSLQKKQRVQRRGFSLLESMISIAMLVSMSGFILNMFTVSEELNLKAKNTDFGASKCINALETFKALENIDEALTAFQGAYSAEKTENGYEIKYIYNSDWIEKSEIDNKEKYFALDINISEDKSEALERLEAEKGGSLYKITTKLSGKNQSKEMKFESFEAKKYFSDAGGD